MDSRYFRADTAVAACKAGGFHLMGRPLLALSPHHFTLLEELGIDFSSVDDLPAEDLEVISLVCSEREPACYFPDLDAPDVLARINTFDADEQNERRAAWLLQCWESRPASRGELEGAGVKQLEVHVPYFLFVVNSILRECAGYTHDQLYFDSCAARVLWIFESMRELRDDTSYIAPGGEAEQKTPAQREAEQAHQARADFLANLVDSRIPQDDPRYFTLLALAGQCRLDDDLNELPEVPA